MKVFTRTLVAAAAITFVVGITQASASLQTPAPQQAAPAQAMSAQGELVKVDVDAKTIAIKSSDGVELQFTYNELTQVKGAQENVAGLASKTGTKVTVQYTVDKDTKTATSIEVQAAKK